MKPTGDSFVGRKGLPEAKLLLEGPKPGPAQLRWGTERGAKKSDHHEWPRDIQILSRQKNI